VFLTARFRRAQLCAVASALLVPSIAGAASASADPLAQERYYSSYGSTPALAQERYYSSYGDQRPLTPASSPDSSSETPWLPIVLSAAGVLAVGVTAPRLQRARSRRAHAARNPA
jgi:hypothetical protein